MPSRFRQGITEYSSSMKRILITGLSGTGKSAVIEVLRSRGYTAIDTDYDGWTEFRDIGDGPEWLLREDRLHQLLSEPRTGPLFVSGCCSNQGKFSEYFDHKVLFSAPLEVMRERILSRTSNPYGKSEAEWAEIVANYEWVLPLLEKGTDIEIDTSEMGVEAVADFLVGFCLG